MRALGDLCGTVLGLALMALYAYGLVRFIKWAWE